MRCVVVFATHQPEDCRRLLCPEPVRSELASETKVRIQLVGVVLGIDPGAANVGYGVISLVGREMGAVDGGVIRTQPPLAREKRLHRIYENVSALIDKHRPAALAIERIYFGRNAQSAMSVGEACGVILVAAGERGLACFEYTPQAIKMAVCGSGGANKDQVKRMIGLLLGLEEPPASDHAADALGAAICHAAGHSLRSAAQHP